MHFISSRKILRLSLKSLTTATICSSAPKPKYLNDISPLQLWA